MNDTDMDPFACFDDSDDDDDDDDDDENDQQHEQQHQYGSSPPQNITKPSSITSSRQFTYSTENGNSTASYSLQQDEQSQGRRLVDEANARLDAATAVKDGLLPVTSSSFEVFDTLTGAGKGLRALKVFEYGDEILREYAAMRVPNHQAAESLEEAEQLHERAVQSTFNNLHHSTQNAIIQLHSCDQWMNHDDSPGRHASGVVTPLGAYQSNSYTLGDQKCGGLFLTTARMNHSCRPSATHIWRPDLQKTVVFATRRIEIGEEIFTTYGPPECLDTEGRRDYLREKFSFECGCEMCEEGNRFGGDDRMIEINSLQEDISMLAQTGDPKIAIDAVERCLSLLKEQSISIGAYRQPLLHYGYQIAMDGLKDIDLAKSYLSKELAVTQQCEGPTSPKALQIQAMLDDLF
ncbi:unnamed protein product [Cylindrotheca closterium]|uniref:SET domain-containing protein n=1 Tax=Cylindrotheca closterium TaxID=2856 RepID=A0AAD2FDQ6_9STRA|nr:unnamed protein product [Cylindrotheca closterium]